MNRVWKEQRLRSDPINFTATVPAPAPVCFFSTFPTLRFSCASVFLFFVPALSVLPDLGDTLHSPAVAEGPDRVSSRATRDERPQSAMFPVFIFSRFSQRNTKKDISGGSTNNNPTAPIGRILCHQRAPRSAICARATQQPERGRDDHHQVLTIQGVRVFFSWFRGDRQERRNQRVVPLQRA